MGQSTVDADPVSDGKQRWGRDCLEDLNTSSCRGLVTEINGQENIPDVELQTLR